MRLDRERWLDGARNGEERALLARALDRAEIVLASGMVQVTGFYDPYRAGHIISLVKAVPGLAATPCGGYSGADQKQTR